MFKAKQNFSLRKKLCNAPVIMQIDNILWKIDQPPPSQVRTLAMSLKFKVIIWCWFCHLRLLIRSSPPWLVTLHGNAISFLNNSDKCWAHCHNDLTRGPCHRSEERLGTELWWHRHQQILQYQVSKEIYGLFRGEKSGWIQGPSCVFTESETIVQQTWFNVYCCLGNLRRSLIVLWWSLDVFTWCLKFF